MSIVLNFVYIAIALCLIATIIGAFIKYVDIPAPFAWLKGIMIFIMIVLACYFVWSFFVEGHVHEGRHGMQWLRVATTRGA